MNTNSFQTTSLDEKINEIEKYPIEEFLDDENFVCELSHIKPNKLNN